MSNAARKTDDKTLSLASDGIAEAEATRKTAQAIDRYYAQATNLNQAHVPVDISLIVPHKMPDVALFLKADIPGQFKIFRNKGLYFSDAELKALSDNGIFDVYIQRADLPAFTQYIEHILEELGAHSPMVDDAKVQALRSSAISVMTDIFDAPTPENIERGTKVVAGFVYMLMRDPKAYGLLLGLSSHDHYTLQHSVGVATNSIILAKKIGIDDEASLIEVGVGGLLHDIGKTKVSRDIINKKGPLDEKEWAEMKQHSLFGYEILKDNPNVGMRAKLAVLQHHEDANGTGYPMGLSLNQIDLYAKIVCIADIYNAITTDRSYSSAKPPFEAFALMKAKLSHKVDPKLFEAMVKIYGGKPA